MDDSESSGDPKLMSILPWSISSLSSLSPTSLSLSLSVGIEDLVCVLKTSFGRLSS